MVPAGMPSVTHERRSLGIMFGLGIQLLAATEAVNNLLS